MDDRFQKYPGLNIEPSSSEEEGGFIVSFWMTADEWTAFKKLRLESRLEKRFELTGSSLYAGNTVYAAKLEFFVSNDAWCGFERSRLFQDLSTYAELLYHEKEYTRNMLREQGCTKETKQSRGRRFRLCVWFQSALAQARKLFHRMRY